MIGLILGPMAESQLRRALQLSQGDVGALFTRPFAAACYIALVVLIVLGLYLRRRSQRMEQALADLLHSDDAATSAESTPSRGTTSESNVTRTSKDATRRRE